jgi:hypothetical protein
MEESARHDSLSARDYAALTALCIEYMWLKDHFMAERVPDLFTEDCIWIPSQETPNARNAVVGREALIAVWSKRTRSILTRTLISNPRFKKDGANGARGWLHFTEYAAHIDEVKVPVPLLVGDWVDTFEKGVDGRWRFKSKRTSVVFGGFRSVQDGFMIVAPHRGAPAAH